MGLIVGIWLVGSLITFLIFYLLGLLNSEGKKVFFVIAWIWPLFLVYKMIEFAAKIYENVKRNLS